MTLKFKTIFLPSFPVFVFRGNYFLFVYCICFSKEAQINNTINIFFQNFFENKILLLLLEAGPNPPLV